MRRKLLLDPDNGVWEAMDLTAMIDVLFILLVFLMLSLGGVFVSLPLNLPLVKGAAAASNSQGQLILLETGGTLFFQNQRFPHAASLTAALPHPLAGHWQVAAEAEAPAGKLVELLHQLNQQGVTQLEVLAQEAP